MKDGQLFHGKRSHFYIFLGLTHLIAFDYYFRATPRKFKIHRSAHPAVFFAASIYVPYRFDAQLNTALFQMTKSANPILNFLLRMPAKVLIYGSSILLGQVLARLYWVYKRSFNASKQATLNTYINYHVCADPMRPYPYIEAFQEVRPNLVS